MAYLRATTIENGGGGAINYSHTVTAVPRNVTTYASAELLNGFAVICNGSSNFEYNQNVRNWAEVGDGSLLDSYSYASTVTLNYDTTTHQFYATNTTNTANFYLHVWKIN